MPGHDQSNPRLLTLGRLQLISDAPGAADLVKRRRKLALLAVLAMERRPVSRDRLLDFFWGSQPEARARHSLSDAISHLRRVLGRESIVTGDEGVSLARDTCLEVDALDVEGAFAAGRWSEVMELYGGRFLGDMRVDDSPRFEEWAERTASRLESLHEEAQRRQQEALAEVDDWHGVASIAAGRGGGTGDSRASSTSLDEKDRPAYETTVAKLRQGWSSANEGRVRAAIIDADDGSLAAMREVSAEISAGGATLGGVGLYAGDRFVAYALLSRMVRSLLEAPGVAATDPESLAELARFVPEVRERFRVKPGKDTNGEGARLRLFEAFGALIDNALFEAPVVFTVTDLQYADEASTIALTHVLRARLDKPLMIVAGAPRQRGALPRHLVDLLTSIDADVPAWALPPAPLTTAAASPAAKSLRQRLLEPRSLAALGGAAAVILLGVLSAAVNQPMAPTGDPQVATSATAIVPQGAPSMDTGGADAPVPEEESVLVVPMTGLAADSAIVASVVEELAAEIESIRPLVARSYDGPPVTRIDSLAAVAHRLGAKYVIGLRSARSGDDSVITVAVARARPDARVCVNRMPRDAKRAGGLLQDAAERGLGVLTVAFERSILLGELGGTLSERTLPCVFVRRSALLEYKAAMDAQVHRDFATAVRRLEKSYELDTTWVASKLKLASLHYARGRRGLADSLMSQVEKGDLSPTQAATLRFQRAYSARDWDGALQAGREHAQLARSGYNPYVFAALGAFRPGEALRALDSLSQNPFDESGRDLRANISWRRVEAYWLRGEYQKVLEEAANFRTLGSPIPNPNRIELLTLAAMGDDARWSAAFSERAPADLAERARWMQRSGNVARIAGHESFARALFARAIAEFEPTVARGETPPELGLTLAMLKREAGELDVADSILVALESAADTTIRRSARFIRIRVAQERGDQATVRALEEWHQRGLRGPDPWRYSINLARLEALRGNHSAAMTLLRQSIALGYSRFVDEIHTDVDLMRLRNYPPARRLLVPEG